MSEEEITGFAEIWNRLNSGLSVAWPEDLLGKWPGYPERFVKRWWQRLAFYFIRKPIEREMRLATHLAAMRIIEVAIGNKECLRFWNTRAVDPPMRMTNAQFEQWWSNGCKWDEAA